MANINIKRQHSLGRTTARDRVQEIANSLQDKLKAKWSWDGDSLNFQRSGASGSVIVGDDFVEFKVKLGLLLSPMKGTIEDAIQQQLDRSLG
ncbi:MAG: polyhydroxyalkanoic acid system family protein [Pseudomonadota bacterium]